MGYRCQPPVKDYLVTFFEVGGLEVFLKRTKDTGTGYKALLGSWYKRTRKNDKNSPKKEMIVQSNTKEPEYCHFIAVILAVFICICAFV